MSKSGMICPRCEEKEVKVVETRKCIDYIRRRRICEFCYLKFTTKERVVVEPLSLRVIDIN